MPDPHTGRTTTYPSKEHALMAHKTVTVEEHESIRTAKEPKSAKARGRRCSPARLGRDQARRHGRGPAPLVRGEPGPREQLVATGDVLILEDSPTDAIWGIRSRGGRFAGTNLLGRAHMAVRAESRR